MKSLFAAYLCASLLTLCLVKATPVYPAVQLKHFSPVDICLFVCGICFDEMASEMMDCANHVCLAKHQFEMVLGLIEVGRTCKNFSKLDSYMLGNSPANNVDEPYLDSNNSV